MKKLNIGCGWQNLDGFINIDKSKEVNPDKVVNIEKGLPFKDNTFDYIFSSHCLEHVIPSKWEFVLNEIVRVAKHKCILELELPFDNLKKRTNIGHYRTFGYWSFSQFYVTEKKREYYTNWKLKRLYKEDNILIKIFFIMFPILKPQIKFKFEIYKGFAVH